MSALKDQRITPILSNVKTGPLKFRTIKAVRPSSEEQEDPHSTLETAAQLPGRNKRKKRMLRYDFFWKNARKCWLNIA